MLQLGDRPIPVAPDGDPLASYLSTIYAVRGVERGQRIALRDDDVDVLAGLVGDDPDAVESRLIELMDCTPEEARKLRALLFRRRTLATAAGVALGLAAMVGTLHEVSLVGSSPAPHTLSLLQPGTNGGHIAPAASSATEERGAVSEHSAVAIGATTPSSDVVPRPDLASGGSITDGVLVDLPLDTPYVFVFEAPTEDTSATRDLPSDGTDPNQGVGDSSENENNAGGGGGNGGDGGDGDDTPGVGDGGDNPGLGDGGDNPGLGDGGDTPGLGDGDDTPGLGDGDDTPGLGDGDDTPGLGDGDDNPGLGDGDDTPGLGDGDDNPGLGDGDGDGDESKGNGKGGNGKDNNGSGNNDGDDSDGDDDDERKGGGRKD